MHTRGSAHLWVARWVANPIDRGRTLVNVIAALYRRIVHGFLGAGLVLPEPLCYAGVMVFPGTPDDLMALLYDELHALAAAQLREQRSGHTLQRTALVNEAYLRLSGRGNLAFESREKFLRLACSVMRNLLVDHARARNAAKRGGAWQRITLSAARDDSASRMAMLSLRRCSGATSTGRVGFRLAGTRRLPGCTRLLHVSVSAENVALLGDPD